MDRRAGDDGGLHAGVAPWRKQLQAVSGYLTKDSPLQGLFEDAKRGEVNVPKTGCRSSRWTRALRSRAS